MGIPAQKGSSAKIDTLICRQPAQRVMRLLGSVVADGYGLLVVRESAAIGKSAGIICGNQFRVGISVCCNDFLGMLTGKGSALTRHHAKRGFPVLRGSIVIDK